MGTYIPPSQEKPRELIEGALRDAREIASAEVDKIKAEAREVTGSAKIAGVGVAAVSVAALLFGQALAWVLVAIGLPNWLSFLIVAVVMGVAGGITVLAMKNRAVEAVTAVPAGLEPAH